MFVTQISVYLENVKGTLCKVTSLLSANSIDILALTIADTSGFGLVRFIVKENDIEKTMNVLKEAGYSSRTNHVICVKVPNAPGGLNKPLTLLDEANISVEYMYSFNYSKDEHALLIFRLSDRDAGLKVLTDGGVSIASQEEINSIGI